MVQSLKGSVALVTGASSGIGEATATELAALGASVVLVARRTERLDKLAVDISNAGGEALAVTADVSDPTQAADAVAKGVAKFGHLDIVVNAAGVMLIGKSEGADLAEWQRMIRTNIDGTLNISHAALPHLLQAAENGPRQVADLINISSSAAHQVFSVNGVYALTKAGIEAFSESLRQEFTQRFLRVGVIGPGAVATELVSHNRPEIQRTVLKTDAQPLRAQDISETIAFMVTRPRHGTINKIWHGPVEQV